MKKRMQQSDILAQKQPKLMQQKYANDKPM